MKRLLISGMITFWQALLQIKCKVCDKMEAQSTYMSICEEI